MFFLMGDVEAGAGKTVVRRDKKMASGFGKEGRC